uniref:L-gulonolactone oxidase n=1 Tax=Ananas comosus var. bracteatus TaxID=296719 RepID=A0A6V7QCU8_ANACO|nr:unnamed protein product [Ananas comosus var. bracteatus]
MASLNETSCRTCDTLFGTGWVEGWGGADTPLGTGWVEACANYHQRSPSPTGPLSPPHLYNPLHDSDPPAESGDVHVGLGMHRDELLRHVPRPVDVPRGRRRVSCQRAGADRSGGQRHRRRAEDARRDAVLPQHSKLVCPGDDGDGLIISTQYLNRIVSADPMHLEMTVEGGATLKELIGAAAEAGMALPYAPYWWGLTVGGMLSTGAHGSSLRGKGSALHEYVVAMRIVAPAPAAEGYAKVRQLGPGHPDLDAAKVSLGVLGIISQVTLKLQPLFKRSVTFAKYGDADLADRAVTFGNQHEFADMAWYPGQGKVIYRIDDRVPDNVPGNGVFNFVGFRSTATLLLVTNRLAEEGLEATGNAGGRCQYSRLTTSAIAIDGYGLTNNGLLFTGYPVVGFQNKIQSSGGCLDGPHDALLTACPWDPRVRGEFFHQTTVSIPLSEAKDFIQDVQKLRDLNAEAFCGVELYNGILMRYVKSSSAYLGKQDDCLDFDITYYRSHDPAVPRLYEDVLEEVEQMALLKYGGMPHWARTGTSRSTA